MSTAEYITTDLNVAAFAVARGHALLRITGETGSRRAFHFPPEARSEADAYYQGAVVPGRAFASTLRDLKARLSAPAAPRDRAQKGPYPGWAADSV